jgi:uracil permease
MSKIMPEEKLPFGKTIAFSFQQLFACFGATILVPIIVGLPPYVALFSAGVGTLIYLACTRFKVPMFLGSSFAFIAPLASVSAASGWNAVAGGIIVAGLFYAVVALVISRVGTQWVNVLFPPVVIGSVIMTIGIGLSATAVQQATQLDGKYSLKALLIAMVTLFSIALFSIKGRGFFKAIPIILGIVTGYVFTLIVGIVTGKPSIDFSVITANGLFTIPLGGAAFKPTFETGAIITFIVVSLATLIEHLGDLFTISGIVGRDFYKDPGPSKTILGDGLATAAAGLFGSVPNVSYGECSATQALSQVHSVRVIAGAAIIAIILSFIAPVSGLINTIPGPVLGGACLILYGLIASSGLRNIVKAGVDYDDSRNLIISSAILTSGIGGCALTFTLPGGQIFSIAGMAFGTVLGIVLNLVLPKR